MIRTWSWRCYSNVVYNWLVIIRCFHSVTGRTNKHLSSSSFGGNLIANVRLGKGYARWHPAGVYVALQSLVLCKGPQAAAKVNFLHIIFTLIVKLVYSILHFFEIYKILKNQLAKVKSSRKIESTDFRNPCNNHYAVTHLPSTATVSAINAPRKCSDWMYARKSVRFAY